MVLVAGSIRWAYSSPRLQTQTLPSESTETPVGVYPTSILALRLPSVSNLRTFPQEVSAAQMSLSLVHATPLINPQSGTGIVHLIALVTVSILLILSPATITWPL